MNDAARLTEEFGEAFPGSGPAAICRAPGRVNLIGEHTDYNGLPVLPMTLDRDVRIAFAVRPDSTVRMRNVDASFPEVTFRNGPRIPPSAAGSWDNYCKAALEGLNQRFKPRRFPGIDMLVCGTIPISAGLSSSSALVVACALAYLRCLDKALGKDISRLELASLLAEAEHYVGTKGGGMDQAIILLGDEGAACKIDFFPLRVERVPLPRDYEIVVCNSLVKANKTGDALHKYNAGPRLCRLICALVAAQARAEFGDEIEIERLGDLWNGHLCLTHAEVKTLFDQTFRRPTMTLVEAARTLKTTPESIRERWLGDLQEPDGGFSLKKRARHQLTETQRVESARDALIADQAEILGELMNASHESCARDYEVSCPELDALVDIARKNGVMGARLTGAGFGGCTVNLVPEDVLDSFRMGVRDQYYDLHLAGRSLAYTPESVFVARAEAGAGYVE